MQIETQLSEFGSVSEIEHWILEILRTRCGIDQRLHRQLENAWYARLESIRLNYPKDYVVVVQFQCFLRRQGPKRPARLARQMEEQREQWRKLREAGGDE